MPDTKKAGSDEEKSGSKNSNNEEQDVKPQTRSSEEQPVDSSRIIQTAIEGRNNEEAEARNKIKHQLDQLGNKLVKEEFPNRITAITALYQTSPFREVPDPTAVHESFPKFGEESTKSTAVGSDVTKKRFTANKYVQGMIDGMNPLINQLLNDVNTIRLLMTLRMADIDNGDNNEAKSEREQERPNFENQILTGHIVEVLTLLAKVEHYAREIFSSWIDYHQKRAEMLTKFEVNFEDSYQTVDSLDQKMVSMLQSSIVQLLSIYITLEDIISETNDLMRADKSRDRTKTRATNAYKMMYQ